MTTQANSARFVDCFVFNNELDLLELRLCELDRMVAFFILVESDRTFSGQYKGFNFDATDSRWAPWRHKLYVERVTDMPLGQHPRDHWQREFHQRNAILRAVLKCVRNTHFVHTPIPERVAQMIESVDETVPVHHIPTLMDKTFLISDVDEIPKLDTVAPIAVNDPVIYIFNQAFYYYHFNCRCDMPWYGTKACSWSTLVRMKPEAVRQAGKFQPYEMLHEISDGGWHFSHFGGVDMIQAKLFAGSHQEYNADVFTRKHAIQERVLNYRDLFERDGMTFHYQALDASYPTALQNDPQHWQKHFKRGVVWT